MAVDGPLAAQRRVDAIVKRMRAPELGPRERAALRCEVLRSGLWEVLAAKLPKQFREAFELTGSGSSAPITPPVATRPPQPVPFERVAALAGQEACLRIRRVDGRTEIVAGKLGDVYPEEILFGAFDVATAERLAQPGDTPLFRRGLDRASTFGIPLDVGDIIVSAVKLPVELMQPGAATFKRNSLRERAEALAKRGEYTPRVDLTNPQAYVVPGTGDQLVMQADFVAAVKVEQNVLATPLVHAIAERAIALLREDTIAAKLTGTASWKALDSGLFDNLTPVIAQLVSEWTSKQGRTTPLGLAYANLERVVQFRHAFMATPLLETVGSAERLLKSGLNTAIAVLCDLGAIATELTKERPEIALPDLVRASAPVLLRMASADLEVFVAVHAVMGVGGHKPGTERHFELVDRGDKLRIEPTAAALELLASKYGLRLETILLGTTGCPAAQSLGAGNPVHQLTDAFADMLAKLATLPERFS